MNGNEQLLTEDEHLAMQLSAELANLMRVIIGSGPQAAHDWNECAQRIHAVQHMILAQAAARAYPDRYRLMGSAITKIGEIHGNGELREIGHR